MHLGAWDHEGRIAAPGQIPANQPMLCDYDYVPNTDEAIAFAICAAKIGGTALPT